MDSDCPELTECSFHLVGEDPKRKLEEEKKVTLPVCVCVCGGCLGPEIGTCSKWTEN